MKISVRDFLLKSIDDCNTYSITFVRKELNEEKGNIEFRVLDELYTKIIDIPAELLNKELLLWELRCRTIPENICILYLYV